MERRKFGKIAMAGALGSGLLPGAHGQSTRKGARQASYAGLGRPPMKWGVQHSMQISDLLRELRRVQIEPSVIGEDREMLEDLIAAAMNDAVHQAEAASQAKMASLMGGMQLPPGMKLPY